MAEQKHIEFTDEITVRLNSTLGGDDWIVKAARVSTRGHDSWDDPVGDKRKETEGLINYLMKHRHGSPFEHGTLSFFVHAPIFVWREWHRHRIGFSYNEESGRYKQLEPVFYLPPADRPMFKIEGWKPGRPKFRQIDMASDVDTEAYRELCKNARDLYMHAYRVYERNLELGFDPGVARIGLPVGIFSSCWVTCNPRSLMHFLSLRTHEPEAADVSYPLYEIEVAARVAEQFFMTGWPITYEAFNKNGRKAP